MLEMLLPASSLILSSAVQAQGFTVKPITVGIPSTMKVAKSPEPMKKLESEYTVLMGSTPEELSKTAASEYARWHRVIEDNNIKMEQ